MMIIKFITGNYEEQINEIRLKLNMTQNEFGQAMNNLKVIPAFINSKIFFHLLSLLQVQ